MSLTACTQTPSTAVLYPVHDLIQCQIWSLSANTARVSRPGAQYFFKNMGDKVAFFAPEALCEVIYLLKIHKY
jgi:hypothetical protein